MKNGRGMANRNRQIAGRLGGLQTVLRHGREHMREIGIKGGRPKLLTLKELQQATLNHGGLLQGSGSKVQAIPIVKQAQRVRMGNWIRGYVLASCENCGRERWVRLLHGKPENPLCRSCANRLRATGRNKEMNNNWKGGQHYRGDYVVIHKPDHPHSNSDGYVKRARLVLEKKLGRYLLEGSMPHHINGIKDDDRPENLAELKLSEHTKLHCSLSDNSTGPKKKRGGIGYPNGLPNNLRVLRELYLQQRSNSAISGGAGIEN